MLNKPLRKRQKRSGFSSRSPQDYPFDDLKQRTTAIPTAFRTATATGPSTVENAFADAASPVSAVVIIRARTAERKETALLRPLSTVSAPTALHVGTTINHAATKTKPKAQKGRFLDSAAARLHPVTSNEYATDETAATTKRKKTSRFHFWKERAQNSIANDASQYALPSTPVPRPISASKQSLTAPVIAVSSRSYPAKISIPAMTPTPHPASPPYSLIRTRRCRLRRRRH